MSHSGSTSEAPAGRPTRRSFTERLACVAAAHPWRTIAIWACLLVLALVSIVTLLSGSLTSTAKMHGRLPDSTIGQNLIQARLTGPQTFRDFVIVRSAGYAVTDPAFRTYVEDLVSRISSLGSGVVRGVSTYYQSGEPTLVSKDHHAMLIPVVMAGTLDQAVKSVDKLHAVVLGSGSGGFRLAETGDASINALFTKLSQTDLERGELFGVPAALIVLVFVFGTLLAAGMPLLLSLVSIVLAVALTGAIGQIYPMSTFVLNVLMTMGLAVGIDYTLFVISRYREERALGLEKLDAIAATGATANRAIFFSGMTVVLAMAGMVVVPFDITIGMGLGVVLVVLTTLLTALILLPAFLGLLGDRVNALPVPIIGRRRVTGGDSGRGGIWERLALSIMHRPAIWLSLAVVALLALAAPVLIMQTGSSFSSATHLPADQYAKQGWDVLSRDFSLGAANPLQVVVDGSADSLPVQQAVARLQASLTADGGFGPQQVAVDTARDLTVISTTLAGDPAGETAQNAVRHLREVVVPHALAGAPATVYVAGNTAGVVDYLAFFHKWLPIALALVLCLSFILLLVAFRSVVIPAKAIAMNLLSVGAAYGLMVLVFQEGVGANLLGLTKVGSIEAWVPLFLFSLLFGLSMDYQVFLLSRIKERFDETGDTREAVGYGVGRTAGIITGAAAIMVCVFAGMASGRLVMFQQMGFGLAVAILIDATVVRTIIVPAAMELLGDWNWYLPRWLRWLPDVSVEGHAYRPRGEVTAPVPARPPSTAGLAPRQPLDEGEPAGS